jgi:regulatory protein
MMDRPSYACPPARLPAVTAIEPDPRRSGSVRVLVDGRAFATVDSEAVRGVECGQPLEAGASQRLALAADAEAAYRTVLRALERRPHARADLGRRLLRRGLAADAVEAALARADRAGLLDDVAFARHYVATRAERGRGPSRLVRDLLGMGVARSCIDQAIAEQWPDDADRRALPAALAAKRAAQLGGLARPVKRRRLLAYLARRGFTGREAVEAVAGVL